MALGPLWDFLFPHAAERDELFNQEILRLSHMSLGVLAAIEIVFPAFTIVEDILLAPSANPFAPNVPVYAAFMLMAVGVVTAAVSRLDWSYEKGRMLAWMSVWLASAMIIGWSLWANVRVPGSDHAIPGKIAIAMLIAVAVVPLQPVHTLALGLTLGAGFWIGAAVGVNTGALAAIDLYDHAALLTLTVLSTVLTAVIYAQRASNYRVYVQVLRASHDLRVAQSQGLQSENATALARLAAAISHEINNPLGAMKSGVQTLIALDEKQADASPMQREKFANLQSDLLRTLHESAVRLEQIVGRLQRFSNLDSADVKAADVNELLRDVTGLIDPTVRARVKVELRLEPLPPIVCRPQQLSGVFSNLLGNAVNASDAGTVTVMTQRVNGHVEVSIRDQGRGIAADDLGRVFDPGFKVADGRIASGNWSLFNARQTIRELGGDIRISSEVGLGTTVLVSLPL